MTENIIPVSPEEHSRNISDIQTYLREIHHSGADIRSVIPDGIYGQCTRDAVSDFQRSTGIPETGEVNKDTWNAIFAAYDDARRNLNMQEGITPFPALDEIMTEGDSGTSVLMLQAMLNTIAGMHINIAMNDMNGYYGENTALAVSEIQAASGLTPTGMTDIRTWNTIVRIFNAAAEDC